MEAGCGDGFQEGCPEKEELPRKKHLSQEEKLTPGEDPWGSHPEKDSLQKRGTCVKREDSPQGRTHGGGLTLRRNHFRSRTV